MRRDAWYVKLLLACGGVGAALLAAELYLRRFPPPNVYMNTRNIVQQSHAMSDPRLGYRWIPGLKRRFRNLEFDTMVTINSMGFRGKELSAPKPVGWKRIVVTGDSFPFGWGVEDDQTAAALLEKRLEKTEVVNEAVAGYCTSQSIEWFAQSLARVQPDLLILFIWGSPSECAPTRVRLERGRLVFDAPEVSAARGYLIRNLRLYTFLGEARDALWARLHRRETEPPPPGPSRPLSDEWRFLDKLAALGREHRFKVLVVHYLDRWDALRPPSEDDVRNLDELRAWILKRGWGFLDLDAALREFKVRTGKSPYFRYDDHWNTYGHEVAAQALAEILR